MIRDRVLSWGATDAEAGARLPGDELLENADTVSTRAISIDAPAADVWPWLAQMGPSPRGGAYTYDWIENLLGLDMHSADRVLPEFQHPQLGDTIAFGPNAMRLERIDLSGCSPGAPRTATGCGPSSFSMLPAAPGSSVAIASGSRRARPASAWSRWNRHHS